MWRSVLWGGVLRGTLSRSIRWSSLLRIGLAAQELEIIRNYLSDILLNSALISIVTSSDLTLHIELRAFVDIFLHILGAGSPGGDIVPFSGLTGLTVILSATL